MGIFKITLVFFFFCFLIFFIPFVFGFERCIACRLCDIICPSIALFLCCGVSFLGFRYCLLFLLMYRRCIYCGFCQHICPTDAIFHSCFIICCYCICFYLLVNKDLLFVYAFF